MRITTQDVEHDASDCETKVIDRKLYHGAAQDRNHEVFY